MTLLYEQRHAFHCSGCILASGFLFLRRHQTPQSAGLGVVVIIIFPLIVVECCSMQFEWRFFQVGVVLPFSEAVRLVGEGAAVVVVGAHFPSRW